MTVTEPEIQRPRIHGVEVFKRQEFGSERFWYEPGNHCVFAGPTGKGKTELAFNLLQYVATPEFPAYVTVCKPSDPTSSKWGKILGFKRLSTYPTPPQLGQKPPGYLVWPKFGDVNQDIDRCSNIMRALLEERYAAGAKGKAKSQCTILLDDTVVLSKIMKLDDIMTTHLAMARAMGIGGWYFVQKPTDSGKAAIWAYGMSEHVFIFFDPDRRNQQRYDEIGGVDPRFIASVTTQMQPYQCLYIRRTGGHMCVIDKD